MPYNISTEKITDVAYWKLDEKEKAAVRKLIDSLSQQ